MIKFICGETIIQLFSNNNLFQPEPEAISSSSSFIESPVSHDVSLREMSPHSQQGLLDKVSRLRHRNPSLPKSLQLQKVSDWELFEETKMTVLKSPMSLSPGSDRGKSHSRPCSPLAVGSCDSSTKVDIQVA